jgi:cysteine desulfurase
MILFNLDINNICASGGSACTSGADQGSHVIRAINNNPNLGYRSFFIQQA